MTIAQDQNAPPRKFELKAESEEFWKVFDRAPKLKKFAARKPVTDTSEGWGIMGPPRLIRRPTASWTGSTRRSKLGNPTSDVALRLAFQFAPRPGLTELQAGSYVFMDTLYRRIGGKNDDTCYYGRFGNKATLRATDEVKGRSGVGIEGGGAEYGLLLWNEDGRDINL